MKILCPVVRNSVIVGRFRAKLFSEFLVLPSAL